MHRIPHRGALCSLFQEKSLYLCQTWDGTSGTFLLNGYSRKAEMKRRVSAPFVTVHEEATPVSLRMLDNLETVDDVMTSGSTLAEVARTLRHAGPQAQLGEGVLLDHLAARIEKLSLDNSYRFAASKASSATRLRSGMKNTSRKSCTRSASARAASTTRRSRSGTASRSREAAFSRASATSTRSAPRSAPSGRQPATWPPVACVASVPARIRRRRSSR